MNESNSRPTPGTIALSLMGWLELLFALMMFALGIYTVSIVFAVVSTVLSLLATQIRRPAWADPLPASENPGGQSTFGRVMFPLTVIGGFGCVAGAVWSLLQGNQLATIALAFLALSMGLQAWRVRAKGG